MRAVGGAAAGQLGFVRGFTRYQWLVFFVVWAGWSLDATDFGLFSLVLRPALTELLGGQPTIAEIGRVGGLLSTVGLLGWALGGFLFGIIADYIGRVRALALSILIYSVFTGLQGLSHSPLKLGIYRFFAGVGTGAEIIVGIPLVAEAFAEVHRAKILGVMMTGGAMGSIIGGQVYALIGGFGWRYVFFAVIAPALLLLLIRRGMVEPEHFQAVRERRRALATKASAARAEDREFLRFVPLQLFNKELRFNTFVGLLFALGTLLAIWTTVIWLPTIQSLMLEKGRHQRGGGRSDYWPQHDAVGYRRDLRLRVLWLHRRSDRTAPDGGILQRWNLGPRSNSVLSRQHNGAVPVFAPDLRVLRAGRFFRPRRLYSRAIPHPCASHRGLVLQRRRPRHHEFRALGSRPPGCSVWRELQQTRRADDLLCAAKHLCDVSRPRDPRRPAATLTETGPAGVPAGLASGAIRGA